jgi:uncharacterized protein (DUF2267 family)
MKSVERSTRAELRALGVSLRSSSLARSAVELAKRLDAEPADTAAVLLHRELRQTMDTLHRRVPEEATSDVEAFLARIAAPDGGHTAD